MNLYDDNDLFMDFYSPEFIHKCGGRRVHSVQNGLIKKAFVARGKLKCWKIATIPLLLMKQNMAAPAFPSFPI